MNFPIDRTLNRTRLAALALVAGGVLGLLAACSGGGGNPVPSDPIINTGGGGGGGKAGVDENEAGESSGGAAQAGRSQGGSSEGGKSNGGDAGEGGSGEGGEAGATPVDPSCPTGDLGFLNQPSKSQKSVFDNTKRLGAHTTLPPLP